MQPNDVGLLADISALSASLKTMMETNKSPSSPPSPSPSSQTTFTTMKTTALQRAPQALEGSAAKDAVKLETEVQQLKSQLKTEQSAQQTSSSRIAKLTQSCDDLRAALKESKESRTADRTQLNFLAEQQLRHHKEVNGWREDSAAWLKISTALEEKQTALNNSLETTLAANRKLRHNLSVMSAWKASKAGEIASLRAELADQRDKYHEAAADAATARSLSDGLDRVSNVMSTHLQTFEDLAMSSTSEKAQLAEELATTAASLSALTDDIIARSDWNIRLDSVNFADVRASSCSSGGLHVNFHDNTDAEKLKLDLKLERERSVALEQRLFDMQEALERYEGAAQAACNETIAAEANAVETFVASCVEEVRTSHQAVADLEDRLTDMHKQCTAHEQYIQTLEARAETQVAPPPPAPSKRRVNVNNSDTTITHKRTGKASRR